MGLLQDPGKKQGKPALTQGARGAGRRVREPEEAIEEEGSPASRTRVNEEESSQSLRLVLYVVVAPLVRSWT